MSASCLRTQRLDLIAQVGGATHLTEEIIIVWLASLPRGACGICCQKTCDHDTDRLPEVLELLRWGKLDMNKASGVRDIPGGHECLHCTKTRNRHTDESQAQVIVFILQSEAFEMRFLGFRRTRARGEAKFSRAPEMLDFKVIQKETHVSEETVGGYHWPCVAYIETHYPGKTCPDADAARLFCCPKTSSSRKTRTASGA